jgi:hypothetical protein
MLHHFKAYISRINNMQLKTLYQIKAFNPFFNMDFTSWKYLIPFKSYTYKRTENTCPDYKLTPFSNHGAPQKVFHSELFY